MLTKWLAGMLGVIMFEDEFQTVKQCPAFWIDKKILELVVDYGVATLQ